MSDLLPELPAEPDLARFAAFAGEDATDELGEALTVAKRLLAEQLANAYRPMPEDVRQEITLEVAAEIRKRRDSPTGASQFAVLEGAQPVRGPRDPLSQVWPILRQYVSPF